MKLLTKESIRIYLIEDDLNDAQFTDLRLKQAGFSQYIHHFNACGKALDNLSRVECAPDAILLDLNMPGMSGLEMLDWLRKKYQKPDIPVFVLTASDDPEDRRKAANAGVTKYFLKAGSFDELIEELNHLIETINQQQIEWEKKKLETIAELILEGKNTTEMVVLADTAGKIVWANEAFVRTTGYTLEDCRGKKPGWLVRGPASDPVAIEMLDYTLLSESECECRSIDYRKDGTPYSVLISLGPVFTEGRLAGFLAIEKVLCVEEKQLATAIGGPRDILKKQVFDLLICCPFDHGNPPSCPLHEVRKVPVMQRYDWLDGLSEENMRSYLTFHKKCLKEKESLNQQDHSSALAVQGQ